MPALGGSDGAYDERCAAEALKLQVAELQGKLDEAQRALSGTSTRGANKLRTGEMCCDA